MGNSYTFGVIYSTQFKTKLQKILIYTLKTKALIYYFYLCS